MKKRLLTLLALVACMCMAFGCGAEQDDTTDKSLKLDKTQITLQVGQREFVNALECDDLSKIVWESYNPSVATVNSLGLITGVAVGSTKVEAALGESKTTVVVTVTDLTADFSLFGGVDKSVYVNEEIDLNYTFKVYGSSITPRDFEISSANEDVLKIDGMRAIALKSGKAELIATAVYGGKTFGAKLNVTVNDKYEIISDFVDTIEISNVAGGSYPDYILGSDFTVLKNGEVTSEKVSMVSSDETVAKVEDGKLVGVKKGNATVSVSYENVTEQLSVKVHPLTIKRQETNVYKLASADALTIKYAEDVTRVEDADGNAVEFVKTADGISIDGYKEVGRSRLNIVTEKEDTTYVSPVAVFVADKIISTADDFISLKTVKATSATYENDVLTITYDGKTYVTGGYPYTRVEGNDLYVSKSVCEGDTYDGKKGIGFIAKFTGITKTADIAKANDIEFTMMNDSSIWYNGLAGTEYVVLANDIDLSDRFVFGSNVAFGGTFDGAGHKITGARTVYHTHLGGYWSSLLVGANNGTIKDLTVENAVIGWNIPKASYTGTQGGLTGTNGKTGLIENVNFSASMYYGHTSVGLFVRENQGTLKNITVTDLGMVNTAKKIATGGISILGIDNKGTYENVTVRTDAEFVATASAVGTEEVIPNGVTKLTTKD